MKKIVFIIAIVLSCLIVNGMVESSNNLIHSQPPLWFSYGAGFASLFALVFTAFYFFSPKLTIVDETEKEKIRIKCTNNNRFPTTIKDIKCDIVLSESESFIKTETVKLSKDWITGIKHTDYYVFTSKNPLKEYKNKKYMKVRILCINILGVKKYYEETFPLSLIHEDELTSSAKKTYIIITDVVDFISEIFNKKR